MRNIRITAAVLFFSLLLVSCEKILETPEDKLPATLNMSFSMDSHSVTKNVSVEKNAGHRFSLTEGMIAVENISFDGRRDGGRKDVFFTSDFPLPHQIHLTETPNLPGMVFDIPQGIYPMIEITLHLGTDDLPAIVLEGLFRRNEATAAIPVRFEYSFREEVRIRAKPGMGHQQIVLDRATPAKAIILVKTESLLRLVNPGMVAQAETVYIDGNEVLLISELTNQSLYNSISARLQQAFDLVIE